MRRTSIHKRLLSLVLAFCLLCSMALPAGAADWGLSFSKVSNDRVTAGLPGRDSVNIPDNTPQYADDDVVRVSIFLDQAGTIEAGYPAMGIAQNEAAIAYRAALEKSQAAIIAKIEKATKEELDVVWNLTLAANLISANVKYGQIAAIEKVSGVRSVCIETAYAPAVVDKSAANPNMATSGVQTGTMGSYAAGYTGAGSRIAIIDTGIDLDHQSFDSGAFDYSLSSLAEKKGVDANEYITGLDLLDADEIAAVLGELHATESMDLTADDLYVNSKIPFGYNYCDYNTNVTHLYDVMGEHGSHVSGIAGANSYVPNGDGTYSNALEEVFVQGVAPDAQLIVMKVFGEYGGAYPADYMAAIEDAVILGADSVNLSLGSAAPGMSTDTTAEYQAILDNLEKSGVVVSISAGNNGAWMDYAENGVPYLYLDDVGTHTGGSPGSYTNSLGVASVDNSGFTALYFNVGGNYMFYGESTEYGNLPFTTLAGKQEYVLIPGIGTPEDFAAIDPAVLSGKIVMCYRGTTSFFEKANAAVEAGAAGVIIVNNEPGMIYLNLTGYNYTKPVASITLADGEIFKSNGTAVTDNSGNVLYWTGTMEISAQLGAGQYNNPFYTMSTFSSWGVPGSLIMKPEITAPGGSIYSVAGAYTDGYDVYFGDNASYETMSGTSMAAPQVAGMAALVAQYIREEGLVEKTGLDERTLAQSLLMSTAVPIMDGNSSYYYPVLQQGAGLANVGAAIMADSYILMGEDATASYADGKVKVELGDDPNKDGVYTFTFTINNLTDEELTYALSADFFTQGAFVGDEYGTLYMDTWATPLAPTVTWKVNGKTVESGANLAGMDFNDDGYINSADGQTLLDFATGATKSLSQVYLADLNHDGEITSYDSYLFLSKLGTSGATVPAGGKATVTVTVTLSDDDRDWLAYYENGAYLEGYVYAESLASTEGVEGTVHSIPVLGFYGNWSDPSMYDKGTYLDYYYGEETRAPYLYGSNFESGVTNGFLITYGDEPGTEYWYGGNPMLWDDVYMPERNAISGVNGDYISTIKFASIRNAAESIFQITDTETGEILYQEALGEVYSAYFNSNTGVWENTYQYLNPYFDGYGLDNNTSVEVSLILVPEYYVDSEGNVDLEALGDGVDLSMTMTVDNEAPEVKDVEMNTDSNTLDLVVSDNQYIAAVFLLDQTGKILYTYEGADLAQNAGDTVEYALDLTDVNGSGFLLQVYDYAYNVSTYEINAQIGEVTDEVDGIELSDYELLMQAGNSYSMSAIVYPLNSTNREVVWSSSDESVVTVDQNGTVYAVSEGYAEITATSTANPSVSATCYVEVLDISVDLNGIVWDEEGSIWFSSFNTAALPEYTKLSGDMLETDYLVSACVAPDGTLYASSMDPSTGAGYLYTVDPETYELTYLNSCSVQGVDIFYADLTYVPAMFGTGCLLGVYGPYVIAIDPVTGESIGIIDEFDSDLVGIASCYGIYDAEYGEYQDVVYLIESNGVVTQEIYYGYEGAVVPYMYYFYGERASMETGIDKSGAWYYNSAYYDGSYLYWSAFNVDAENAVTLYAIDADYTGAVYNLGQFADGVWPVSGLHQLAPAAGSYDAMDISKDDVAAMIAAKGLPQYELTAQRAVDVKSAAVSELPALPMADTSTVTVQITAKDATGSSVSSTNGVTTVTYDPAVLELMNVVINGDYTSKVEADGSVTIGYVSLDALNPNAVVATLTFAVKSEEYPSIHVAYEEVNDTNPDYSEDVDLSTVYALGDVNCDGEVDVMDANLVIAYYYGNVELDDTQLLAADVNGDTEIDVMDANLIIAYYYGNIDKFPIEG